MRYLKQPRGPGTGWAFRMATPEALVGKLNPSTGTPFGREISFGLKTRRLAEARARRDVLLGQLRALVMNIEGSGRFSLERAEGWAEEIARQEKDGDGGPEDLDLREIVEDELERAKALPASKRPRKEVLDRFRKVSLRSGFPFDEAVTRYLDARRQGNPEGNRPLSRATVNDVRTTVSYLKKFMGGGDGFCLQDINRKAAQEFSFDFLPRMTTPRAPNGLSAKTIG